jgi:hypothetical protein
MVHQKQGKSTLMGLSDKVKIFYSWKDSMSLTEVGWCYGKNESAHVSDIFIWDKVHEIRSVFWWAILMCATVIHVTVIVAYCMQFQTMDAQTYCTYVMEKFE